MNLFQQYSDIYKVMTYTSDSLPVVKQALRSTNSL